jgi:hypothetical protein
LRSHRYRTRPTISAAWLVAAAYAPQAVAQAGPPNLVIDTMLMRSVTRTLSHDSLLGRATGTREAEVAARYIASTCQSVGLAPLEGAFLHRVPTARAILDTAHTTFTLTSARERRVFRAGSAFLPTGARTSTLTGFAGEAVFVGDQDDISSGADGDLTGKVAVTGASLLNGATGEILRRRGAVGVVQMIDDPAAQRYVESLRGRAPLYVQGSDASSFYPPLPTIAAWSSLSDAVRDMARVTSTTSLPIDLNLQMSVEVAYHSRDVTSYNVACVLPGSIAAARDSAIVFVAHYDHLGVQQPDATGDSIYNGFSDNAAGVAMLLAIGQAMTSRADPPKHSVLFLFPTGEEKGLLGSDYFVAHPLWTLGEMLGVIDLDAGAPPAPPIVWRIAGGDSSALGTLAVAVAQRAGWSASTSAARANTDYHPFWREGVPAIFIIPGEGPYEGLSAEASHALRQRWDRYHQPGDEWSADFPFGGLARYAGYAWRVADALDRGGLRPGVPNDRPKLSGSRPAASTAASPCAGPGWSGRGRWWSGTSRPGGRLNAPGPRGGRFRAGPPSPRHRR